MEAAESQICSVGQQGRDTGDLLVQVKSKSVCQRISSCLRSVFWFYLGLQLVGRGPPNHGGQSATQSSPISMLLSSKATLQVNTEK